MLSRTSVALAVVVGGLVLGASPAAAHAELVSTEPANGQVLATPPEQVVLRFSETVEAPDDAIEVFDGNGDQLDTGGPSRPDGTAVAVDVPELEDGAYVVTWRVTSADSHPIRGGFVFRVGEAGSAGDDAEAEALMDRLVAGEGGDAIVGVTYGVVRFAAFAGLVLLVGGAAFVALLWPGGAADPRIRRLLGLGWLVTAVATVLAFGLQGAYAAGDSLGAAVDPSTFGDVLGTRTGRVWLVRLVLLLVILLAQRWLLALAAPPAGASEASPGLRRLADRVRSDGARLAAVVGLGLGLMATVSFAGHAASGDLVPLALVADVAHLSGASVWVGGLIVLVLVVLRPYPGSGDGTAGSGRSPTDAATLEPVISGFSTLAMASVVTLVVTGTIQGIRQTQGFEALFDTTYGRLLIVKVLIVMAIVAAGWFSRSWVRQRWTPSVSPAVAPVGPGAKSVSEVIEPPTTDVPTSAATGARPGLGALRRSVGIEAVLAAVVLAVTALLVNTVPGREATDSSFGAELHGSTLLVRVAIDPAEAGTADVRIETLSHGGEPLAVQELTATLAMPERDIAPIPLLLEPDGSTPGRYVARDATIPFGGTWQLEITARTSEFDESEVSAEVPIR